MIDEGKIFKRQPFYKIPLFYIVITLLLAVGFGGGWILRGKKDVTQPKNGSQSGVSNPIVIPKSAQSVSVDQGTYSGWSEFADSAFSYKLYYPASWTLQKSSADQVTLTTPDQQYELVFALVKNADISKLPEQVLYKGLTLVDIGKMTILQTEVVKQKSIDAGKSKQYFYPYGSAKTQDGIYAFSASFEPVSTKSLGDVDLENTDYRPIAEKILSSIELN